MTAPRPAAFGQRLTKSERSVLILLANGRTVAELMTELGLARHTINSHRSQAYRRLGVHTLHDAVLAAIKARIIAPEDIVTGPMTWIPQLAEAQASIARVRAQAERWRHRQDRRRAAEELLNVLDGPGFRAGNEGRVA